MFYKGRNIHNKICIVQSVHHQHKFDEIETFMQNGKLNSNNKSVVGSCLKLICKTHTLLRGLPIDVLERQRWPQKGTFSFKCAPPTQSYCHWSEMEHFNLNRDLIFLAEFNSFLHFLTKIKLFADLTKNKKWC